MPAILYQFYLLISSSSQCLYSNQFTSEIIPPFLCQSLLGKFCNYMNTWQLLVSCNQYYFNTSVHNIHTIPRVSCNQYYFNTSVHNIHTIPRVSCNQKKMNQDEDESEYDSDGNLYKNTIYIDNHLTME